MEALPDTVRRDALLTAGICEEDIRLADEAVQAALVTGERAYKLPEVLRKELLARLDLESKVPSCEGAIASLTAGSVAPGSNAGLKVRYRLFRTRTFATITLTLAFVSRPLQHFTLRMAELIEKMGRTTYNDLADALLSDLNSADVQAEEKVCVAPFRLRIAVSKLTSFIVCFLRIRMFGAGSMMP